MKKSPAQSPTSTQTPPQNLSSASSQNLKAFLAEKAKERADAIFDDALLLEIRNRVKAQINKALMEDFEGFQKKQVEVLRQHLEGDNAAAVLDDTVIDEGGA